MKDIEESAVTAPLFAQIDSYRETLNVLKFCKGEEFSAQHWAELFDITQMPAKTIDKLLFKDFLQASSALVDNADKLKGNNNLFVVVQLCVLNFNNENNGEQCGKY